MLSIQEYLDLESGKIEIPKDAVVSIENSEATLKFDFPLTNYGTIVFQGTSAACIDTPRFINAGQVIAEQSKLCLKSSRIDNTGIFKVGSAGFCLSSEDACLSINSKDGKFICNSEMLLSSGGGRIHIHHGVFEAKSFEFAAPEGAIEVFVDEIIGEVRLAGESAQFCVNRGHLNIVSQCLSGDPAYLSGGDLSVPSIATGGDDLIAIAQGNITAGDIDTTGGSDEDAGWIWMLAGVTNLEYNGTPVVGDYIYPCTECLGGPYTYNFDLATSSATMTTGSLSAKQISLGAQSVTVGGAVTVSGAGSNLTGEFGVSAGASLIITTDVNADGVVLVGQDVTISGDISATGAVQLFISGALSMTGAITAGSSVQSLSYVTIDATGGTNASINVTGAITAAGQITLNSNNDIYAGSISNAYTDSPSNEYMQINISANISPAGSPDAFVIGGGGNNGIGSTISSTVNTYENTETPRAIIISNGVGDITITDGGDIIATGTQAPAANITILSRGGDGTVTLNTGTLSADGQPGYPAGFISIAAGYFVANSGAAISASNDAGIDNEGNNYILIATGSITYNGAFGITCNGDFCTGVNLFPLYSTLSNYTTGALTIGGSGVFTVTTNGIYGQSNFAGIPVTFNNSDAVNIIANGEQTTITIIYNADGDPGGATTLNFTGSGPITLNADSPDGDSYQINVFADVVGDTNAPLTFSCNGYEEVGTIIFQGSGTFLNEITATANCLGSGNGGNISLYYMDEITLDSSKITANAGTGGNGGSINFFDVGTLNFTGSMDVSGNGDGNGGSIIMTAGYINLMDGSAQTISANGSGAGNGGQVYLLNQSDTYLDGSSAALTLSAQALGTGNGGSVTVTTNGYGDIYLDTSYLLVTAGSSGIGGSITLNADNINFETQGQTINVDGANGGGTISLTTQEGDIDIGDDDGGISLSAQALSSGNGGSITISAYGDASIDTDYLLVTASTGGIGGNIDITGNNIYFASEDQELNADGQTGGGTIALTTEAGDINVGTDDGSVSLSAQALSSGNGGTISIDSGEDASIDASSLLVTASSGGSGGTISVMANSITFPTSGQTLNADGEQGGGTIWLTTNDGDLDVGSDEGGIGLSAQATSSGNGGTITLTAAGTASIDSASLLVTAGTNGNGGNISISADSLSFSGEGSLNADSNGSGDGGSIALSTTNPAQGQINFGTNTFTASADQAGAGGTISISQLSSSAESLDLSAVTIECNAGANGGDAGTVNITFAATLLELNLIEAIAEGDGNGGTVNVNATADSDVTINVAQDINTGADETISTAIEVDRSNFGDTASAPNSVYFESSYGLTFNLFQYFHSVLCIIFAKNITINLSGPVALNLGEASVGLQDAYGTGNYTVNSATVGSSITIVANSSLDITGAFNSSSTTFQNNKGQITGAALGLQGDTQGNLTVINQGNLFTTMNTATGDYGLLTITASNSLLFPSDATLGNLQGDITISGGTIQFDGFQNLYVGDNSAQILSTSSSASLGMSFALGSGILVAQTAADMSSPAPLTLQSSAPVLNNGTLTVTGTVFLESSSLQGNGTVQALNLNVQSPNGDFSGTQSALTQPVSTAPTILSGSSDGAFAFTLTADTNGMFASNITATNDLTLVAQTAIQLISSPSGIAQLTSENGSLYLQVVNPTTGPSILVPSNSALEAENNIYIFLGNSATGNLLPPGTAVTGINQSGNVLYGQPLSSVSTGTGSNTITAATGSTIILNPGGFSGSSIALSGSVTITTAAA